MPLSTLRKKPDSEKVDASKKLSSAPRFGPERLVISESRLGCSEMTLSRVSRVTPFLDDSFTLIVCSDSVTFSTLE